MASMPFVWTVLNDLHDFDRNVFADEACFAVGPDGRLAMWYPRNGRPVVQQSQYPAKVHVLGAISIFGTVGNLSFAPTWNAATFANGIEVDVAPTANALFNGNWHLQLDNATAHTAAAAQHHLLTNGVPSIFFQPPSSPDLNPIENVWSLLKRRIAGHNCQTAQQLRQALTHEWQALAPGEVAPFATSMADRVQSVMAAAGGHTKY